MARATSLLLGLLQAAAVHLSVASDACESQGAAEAVHTHHLLDLSDAGTEFFQRSKLAIRRGKEVGEMALQSAANLTQEPITKVKPMDCEKDSRPLQSIKGEKGFFIAALDVNTGDYESLFRISWNRVKGDYADLNACDINPFDDIIYCVMRADGESYVVRIDEKTIEFVALLPASVFSAASFAYTGEFFVSMSGAETIAVPPLHELQGYEDREDKKLKNYKNLQANKPPGFESISDSVVIEYLGETYLLVLYGPKLQIALYENGVAMQTWIKDVEPNRWDNIYGAGWNFAGKVFFSTNRGAGVYAIPVEEIDLENEEQVIQLQQVGLSKATDFNDGMNCKNAANPWAYTGVANGTIATPTGEPAAAAPAEPDSPVAAGMPGDEAPPPAAEAAAPPPAAEEPPVAAAPPPVAAALPPPPEPKAPPPPGTGFFGFLIFLVIPCMLCCLRQSQKNQSDFLATPYPTGRLHYTPPPSSERVFAAPAPPAPVRSAPVVLTAPPPEPKLISEPVRPASPISPARPQTVPAVPATMKPSQPYVVAHSVPAVPATMKPSQPQVISAVPATMQPSQLQVVSSAPATEVIISQPPQVSAFTTPSMVVATSEVLAGPPPSVTTIRQAATPDLGSSFGGVTITSEVPIVEFAPTAAPRLAQPMDVSFGTVTSEVPVRFSTGNSEVQEVSLASPTIASAPSPVSSGIYQT